MNEKVNLYLERLPSPQKEVCIRLRQIIFSTFPDIVESFKNGVPWYEDKFYLVGLKDHVNIGFAIKGLSQQELELLEGNAKIMRHIKVHSLQDLDEKRIIKALQAVKDQCIKSR